MFLLSRISLVTAALAFSSSAAMAASVFNFDSDTAGKGTAFTDTNSGISATFSSSSDPNGFVVEDPATLALNGIFFQSLTGNVLIDKIANSKSNLTLTILFSSMLSNVSLDFAVDATSSTPFTLQAIRSGTSVGSVIATDSVPAGFTLAEGVATFSSSNFNEIILSSTADSFAVDNITVTAATVSPVPEPGSFSMLGFPLFMFVFPWLRRRLSGKEVSSRQPNA